VKFGSHNNYKCATKKQKLKVVKAGCLKFFIVDTFIYMFSAIPTVQVLSPKYPVDYGRTVTLECVVESYPPHTDVTWYRIVDGARNRVVTTVHSHAIKTNDIWSFLLISDILTRIKW
jgi:hypothetical protein